MTAKDPETLRQQILDLAEQYGELTGTNTSFSPDDPRVSVSGKVVGGPEARLMTEAALDLWLTTGRFNDTFEGQLSDTFGLPWARTCNSGSSANLIAFSALTSPFAGPRKLEPGDEVITCATGFPTTVNPSLQTGMVPVFVDVEPETYNIDVSQLEAALSDRTKAIMVAHTLGNPFDLGAVMRFAEAHNLFVIEDCCDALGSTYQGQHVGTFGDLATLSFYPAHHITMGEGGAVLGASPGLRRAVESFRDWGRDCWCAPGADNTCGRRFQQTLGQLPTGYDHKYVYSHLGYNLKITDMQAAAGVAQMKRLDGFIADRKRNWQTLNTLLADLDEAFVRPKATANSDPSWFGYCLSIRDNRLDRTELLQALNAAGVATRLLFAGNLIRQPYMQGRAFRTIGDLTEADRVMTHAFWLGVHPGLSDDHLEYVSRMLHALVHNTPLPKTVPDHVAS